MGKAKRLRKKKSARKLARKMCHTMGKMFCVQLEAMKAALSMRFVSDKLVQGGYIPKISEPQKVVEPGQEIVLPEITIGQSAILNELNSRNTLGGLIKDRLESNDFCDYCVNQNTEKCTIHECGYDYNGFNGKKVVEV